MDAQLLQLSQQNSKLEDEINRLNRAFVNLGSTNSSSTLIPAPERFTLRKTQEWTAWIAHYERYRFAINITVQSEKAQINNLLLFFGTEVNSIFAAIKKKESDFEKYDDLKAAITEFFENKINLIYERAKFNLRNQQEGESAREYVTCLTDMVQKLKYGSLADELLRDRIVVGILDKRLSESLQMDDNLNLEKAINKVLQAETVKAQARELRGSNSGAVSIDKLFRRKQMKRYTPKQQPTQQYQQCNRCGARPSHSLKQCPAIKYKCQKCKIEGHFAKYCRTREVREINNKNDTFSESESDECYIPEIIKVQEIRTSQPWRIKLKVNGNMIPFKVDTGADETVISSDTVRSLNLHNTIKRTKAVLVGPGKGGDRRITVHGYITPTVHTADREQSPKVIKMFVIDTTENLLGRPALTALNMVEWKDEKLHMTKAIRSIHSDQKTTRCLDKAAVEKQFPQVFKGLGLLKGIKHEIKIKNDIEPYAVQTPRRIPIPLLDAVRKELDRMVSLGVIVPVNEPTEWCAPIVVVPKNGGEIRLCIDYTELNKGVRREKFMLPSVDESVAELGDARVFSRLDCASGFWQVELSEKSQEVTTFITPFGRFKYRRLPFGITSGPEVFQEKLLEKLRNRKGVRIHADDFLVTGRTVEEHNKNLTEVLQRMADEGITLNPKKCAIGSTETKYLGYIISSEGIKPDPENIRAITEYPKPKNVTDVRQFLGMINYITKFLPNMADRTRHIRELLHKDKIFGWNEVHQQEFNELKELVTRNPVLAYFDTHLKTRVTSDASSFGIGAVLEQEDKYGVWRPIYYCSKSLSPTERRYAQIEKEALAITWACERFQQYLIGKKFEIRTDHKPLLVCLHTKEIGGLTARLQRFRMRLTRFDYDINYVPGKELFTADALSRAPLENGQDDPDVLSKEFMVHYIGDITQEMLLTTNVDKTTVKSMQEQDESLVAVKQYVMEGWPVREKCKKSTLPFYRHRGEIAIYEEVLCHNDRIIIPERLRRKCLEGIHIGHQGVNSCRNRARATIWWPGMSGQIKEIIESCEICIKNSTLTNDVFLSTELPNQPWEVVGADLFELTGKTFLVVQDYYSKYPEIARLRKTRSKDVINRLKDIFARHGIPKIVRTDNGPQFDSNEFKKFSKCYGFQWTSSSPHYPQSNGLAESGVKTMKRILKKCDDPFLGLLAYRNTPLGCGYSPAQLLNGRRLREIIPTTEDATAPKYVDHRQVFDAMKEEKRTQKVNFESRHRCRPVKPLKTRQIVWITDRKEEGVVQCQLNQPRSYQVQTETGSYRRNRKFLKELPQATTKELPQATTSETSPSNLNQNEEFERQSTDDQRPKRKVRVPRRFLDYVTE